jgi:hypothetical protein
MPATFQYWRVFVNGPTTGSSVVALAEVVFLDTNNIPISTSGGTASASSVFSGDPASNAFDGNPSTVWASNANPSSGSPQWLQYQFTGAVPVVAVAITIGVVSQSPPTFLIQSSPDGTTWTTQNTVAGFNWSTQGQIGYFDASTVVGNARASQVAIEVANKPAPNALVSQVSREVIDTPSIMVRTSTAAVELLINASPIVQATQVVVELVYPFVFIAPKPIQQFMLP